MWLQSEKLHCMAQGQCSPAELQTHKQTVSYWWQCKPSRAVFADRHPLLHVMHAWSCTYATCEEGV